MFSLEVCIAKSGRVVQCTFYSIGKKLFFQWEEIKLLKQTKTFLVNVMTICKNSSNSCLRPFIHRQTPPYFLYSCEAYLQCTLGEISSSQHFNLFQNWANTTSVLTKNKGPSSLGITTGYPGTLQLAGSAWCLTSPPLRRAPLRHTGALQGNKSD